MSVKIPVNKRLNIHLIGSGGTGGYALACLCRLLAGGDHTIHVYDGDRVETKNLKRQNFRVKPPVYTRRPSLRTCPSRHGVRLYRSAPYTKAS